MSHYVTVVVRGLSDEYAVGGWGGGQTATGEVEPDYGCGDGCLLLNVVNGC